MRGRHRWARAFIVLLLAAGLVWPSPAGSEGARKRWRGYTVTQRVYEALEKTHALLADEFYDEAALTLDEMSKAELNPHERALLHQTRAYMLSGKGLYKEAARSFELCLAERAMPEAAELNIRYNLAQLYLAVEEHERALDTLSGWFEEAKNPGPSAYYLLAIIYMQLERSEEAFEPARQAVEGSSTPREPWLQLLLALYYDKEDYPAMAGLLERLATGFPKASYWRQLAAVYAHLGREEDALAVGQIAYELGFVTEDKHLQNLARMYLLHEIPYRAAAVLERGIAEELIEQDSEAWELLADSWLSAHEQDRALGPLEKAAKLSDTGDLHVRLGRLHVEQERWEEASEVLQGALEKEELDDRGRALILLGMALYQLDRLEEAADAFADAVEEEDSRLHAERWLMHIERRLARGR